VKGRPLDGCVEQCKRRVRAMFARKSSIAGL
jgi:hypothetical protein